ncbi:hypothetical protein G3M48_002632 [Beauveria asiatica]|uniref:protein-tyrosine-phosphatase n=1 Tax=Beauveria asiatica TaxID=1069075 RepID=A0AAW0RXG2_9HYPO
MPEKISILFVCLGNICRSTMAEGIFRHLAQKPEWKDKIGRIDSCGTGMSFCFLIFLIILQKCVHVRNGRLSLGVPFFTNFFCAFWADGKLIPPTAAYHTGDSPDDRTMATLEENGITDYHHSARRVRITFITTPPLYSCALASCLRHLTHACPLFRRVQATHIHAILAPCAKISHLFFSLQFATSDFEKFDYIFAMDRSNLSDLVRLQRGNPDAKARVMLFGEYSGAGKAEIVNDPYYGGDAGFKCAFEQCTRFSQNFLAEVVDGGGEKTASL